MRVLDCIETKWRNNLANKYKQKIEDITNKKPKKNNKKSV